MLHGASSLVRVYEPRGSSIGAAAFELTILERLRHPNVIKVVDAWALAGRGCRFRAKPCWGPVWSRLLRWHIRDIIPSPGFEPPRAQAFIIRPGEPWGLVAGVLTGCRQEREREREKERKTERERKIERLKERQRERERQTGDKLGIGQRLVFELGGVSLYTFIQEGGPIASSRARKLMKQLADGCQWISFGHLAA